MRVRRPNDTRRGYAATFTRRFVVAWLLALPLACLGLMASARGITTISQSYTTADNLAIGSIVSLKDNFSDEVVAATSDNVDSIIGVVIDSGDSLLSLSSGQSKQIQVATSGVVPVLVSDINGSIGQGDQITSSPVAGVGMKATTNTRVVGISQGELKQGADNSSIQDYTDKSGQKHTLLMGTVPVLVNVSYYYKQPDKTLVPASVQNIANAVAGKKVNPLPVIISVGVFFITLVVVVSIIYSMIRSSIISVGRNPMSQSAVYRDLIQMSALVLGILGVAVVAIYMILTRF